MLHILLQFDSNSSFTIFSCFFKYTKCLVKTHLWLVNPDHVLAIWLLASKVKFEPRHLNFVYKVIVRMVFRLAAAMLTPIMVLSQGLSTHHFFHLRSLLCLSQVLHYPLLTERLGQVNEIKLIEVKMYSAIAFFFHYSCRILKKKNWFSVSLIIVSLLFVLNCKCTGCNILKTTLSILLETAILMEWS